MPKPAPSLTERHISIDPTEPTPSNDQAVQASNVPTVKPADDKKVFSYKIRLTTGQRFSRYARYQTDRAIGEVADQALLEFLERNGG